MSTDESLAKALGWTHPCDGRCHLDDESLPCKMPWGTTNYHAWTPPAYSDSFDLCLRDIVPVLRARGLCVRITDVSDLAAFDYDWHVDIRQGDHTGLVAHGGVSLPAAFCEAALKALEATENPGD